MLQARKGARGGVAPRRNNRTTEQEAGKRKEKRRKRHKKQTEHDETKGQNERKRDKEGEHGKRQISKGRGEIHVVVGINPTGPHDVCASTVHYYSCKDECRRNPRSHS